MRVLVCGDRNWTDKELMHRYIGALPSGTTVMHGGARGADSIAGEIAQSHGLQVELFEADWARYGRGAGPVRNRRMIETGPDLVLAFHNYLWTGSKGTRDCVKRALSAGIHVDVVSAP